MASISIRYTRHGFLLLLPSLLAALSVNTQVGAETFTPGNVIVANGGTVYEYTTAGGIVQTIPVEPADGGTDVLVRDAAVDLSGRLHVMTFSPGNFMASEQAWLSTYDPRTSIWQHNTIAGWSLPSVTYYGSIGINDQYVYCPDGQTGGGENDGIIRFSLDDLSSPVRFHEIEGPGYNDWHTMTIGLDERLYALNRDGALHRYDADTMELLEVLPSVNRGASVMGVAVDADSSIYTVDLDGVISRFDAAGQWIESVTGGFDPSVDIEIWPDGTLLIASAGEVVNLTTTSLDDFQWFDTGEFRRHGIFDRNFIAATVTVPEPATVTLFAVAILVAGLGRLVRNRFN